MPSKKNSACPYKLTPAQKATAKKLRDLRDGCLAKDEKRRGQVFIGPPGIGKTGMMGHVNGKQVKATGKAVKALNIFVRGWLGLAAGFATLWHAQSPRRSEIFFFWRLATTKKKIFFGRWDFPSLKTLQTLQGGGGGWGWLQGLQRCGTPKVPGAPRFFFFLAFGHEKKILFWPVGLSISQNITNPARGYVYVAPSACALHARL